MLHDLPSELLMGGTIDLLDKLLEAWLQGRLPELIDPVLVFWVLIDLVQPGNDEGGKGLGVLDLAVLVTSIGPGQEYDDGREPSRYQEYQVRGAQGRAPFRP
jgi:hypothetical protein